MEEKARYEEMRFIEQCVHCLTIKENYVVSEYINNQIRGSERTIKNKLI